VSGAFPDENEFGVRITRAENDLVAMAMELASRAIAQVSGDSLECVAGDAFGTFKKRWATDGGFRG
jgi:hypothetical protein